MTPYYRKCYPTQERWAIYRTGRTIYQGSAKDRAHRPYGGIPTRSKVPAHRGPSRKFTSLSKCPSAHRKWAREECQEEILYYYPYKFSPRGS